MEREGGRNIRDAMHVPRADMREIDKRYSSVEQREERKGQSKKRESGERRAEALFEERRGARGEGSGEVR